MELVAPIRNKEQIEDIKQILAKNGTRDLLLFIMGINSGLRISDILPLKKSDVITGIVTIKEKKTGKHKQFPLNGAIQEVLQPYIKTLADNDYLFRSRQNNGKCPYMTRQQAYNIINSACRAVGINDRIGTHTLRKTFGYWHYQQFHDVAILQKILNHSAPSITLQYIGITQDIINKSYQDFGL